MDKDLEQRTKQLMESGQVVLEPLTYIRGRSIPHQFMIVDESQNLTPHEVKTIASRVGGKRSPSSAFATGYTARSATSSLTKRASRCGTAAACNTYRTFCTSTSNAP